MPISATFRCAACGGVAATVTLVAPGEAVPPTDGIPPGTPDLGSFTAAGFPDRAQLIVAGGPVPKAVAPVAPTVVAAALRGGDAALLYALDAELVPFWCPACEASYCAEHYRSWVTFDEGFYDATYGVCPAGHERMLDD